MWRSPDAKCGVFGRGTGTLVRELFDGPDKQFDSLPAGRSMALWHDWSPNSQTFAGQTHKTEIALFRRDGKFLRYLTGMSGLSRAARFAPDGFPRLAAASDDHTLRVWNTETGRQLWCGVQLSPDEAAILNDQGEVVIGDPATVERELIYRNEYDDGSTAVLTPSQFKTRFGDPQ